MGAINGWRTMPSNFHVLLILSITCDLKYMKVDNVFVMEFLLFILYAEAIGVLLPLVISLHHITGQHRKA